VTSTHTAETPAHPSADPSPSNSTHEAGGGTGNEGAPSSSNNGGGDNSPGEHGSAGESSP
jgi:hypothetical protein